MEFAQRLRTFRKEKKETQVQVAEAVGMTTRQYQSLEAGTSLPGFQNLLALADHFGVSIDRLVGRGEDQ